VYAFWHIFRANVAGKAPANTPAFLKLESNGHFKAPDVALHANRSLTSYLARYLFAMERLSGRKDMRDDPSSYEAVGMTLVDVAGASFGDAVAEHPPAESELRHDRMFAAIYRQYDLRFVYQSPALKSLTRRLSWSDRSPALSAITGMDFEPRLGIVETDDEAADAMEDATEDAED
jgi:hypothetical protein